MTFLARMAALLDDEFPEFLVALSQRHRVGLRVNTLKITPERLRELVPWPLEPIPWCPEGFLLPGSTNAGLYPLHDAGLYYIQEPSTMAVGTLLRPQPGERVLDLCAAPGGKATHLAALMAGKGLLVANDIDPQRTGVLVRNLERWGVRNAIVLNERPERLAERWPQAFDRVLVDAPCSGEGMFRKSQEARYHWSQAHVRGCAWRQRHILEDAARMVRPGGWLGYATCTFAPEENEGVVWHFLKQHPDFELEEPLWFPGFERGRPEWACWPDAPELDPAADEAEREGCQERIRQSQPEQAISMAIQRNAVAVSQVAMSDKARLATLRRTVRLWPHKVAGEGHFVAIMRRAGEEAPRDWPPAQSTQLSVPQREALEDFWRAVLGLDLPDRLLVRSRDRQTAEVYALALDAPDTTGLRAPRPGWHLGQLRLDGARGAAERPRFIPAHALALALEAGHVRQRLDEPMGSELIARYLRGEALPVTGLNGWVLISVAGFPLGWGRGTGHMVKNHFPKALRWL